MVKTFFNNLQDHSAAKIEVLNQYYIPWLRKINMGPFNMNRCLVIDGFAGPGIYEDGSQGSPIKLIEGAIDFCVQCEQNSWKSPSINIILIEGDKKNFDTLQKNIQNLYLTETDENGVLILKDHPTVRIIIYNDAFQNVFRTLLDDIKIGQTLIPSFSFVDPFGFSHTPFELFEEYLKNEKSELLFNFMFEEINRFIMSDKHSKLVETYQKLFGIDNIEELRTEIGSARGNERKQIVVDYYSRRLLTDTEAKHVLNFEFRKNGRAKMFLIYATKNIHGLALMKTVMWKIDDTGTFLFDDRLQANQINFEFVAEMQKEEMQKDLSIIIHSNFKGQKNVMLDTLERFVLTKTIYPLTNYFKPALKLLEKAGLITVHRKTGAKKGSFNEKTKFLNF